MAKKRKTTEARTETKEIVLDALKEKCDVILCIVPHQAQQEEEESSCADVDVIIVYAPSYLLFRVSFFADMLIEPWRAMDTVEDGGCGRRKLTVDCCASTSPTDYCRCLLFLQPHQEFEIPSINVAVKLLRVADHLLFKECADACMAFLAAAPWSPSEYEDIQKAISSVALKPSPDLAEKLDPSKDVSVLQDFIHITAESARADEGKGEVFNDFVRRTICDAPTDVVKMCLSASMEVWLSCAGISSQEFWLPLTGILLQYADTKEVVQAFVDNSFGLAFEAMATSQLADILTQIFLRSVPTGGEEDTMTLLSNSDRAHLVATWAPFVAKLCSDKALTHAFAQVVYSLPPQEPSLLNVVKKNHSATFFKPCFTWWYTSLLKRMNQCEFIHEEVASNTGSELATKERVADA